MQPSGSSCGAPSLRATGEGQGGLGVPHGGLCCPAFLILPPKESDVIDPHVCVQKGLSYWGSAKDLYSGTRALFRGSFPSGLPLLG